MWVDRQFLNAGLKRKVPVGCAGEEEEEESDAGSDWVHPDARGELLTSNQIHLMGQDDSAGCRTSLRLHTEEIDAGCK